MDQVARAQIRLILEDVDDLARKAVREKLQSLYADHTAKGLLRSGATIKAGLRILEDEASRLITCSVDQASNFAKDIEAFAMLQEGVQGFLSFLEREVDGIIDLADRPSPGEPHASAVAKGALNLFAESKKRLTRQLELHRIAFTVPFPRPLPISPLTIQPTAEKSARNIGGKPLAKHWDQLWATIAVKLYTGDLQPQSQADIEKAMSGWCAANDVDIGQTAIRDRARVLWMILKNAK